MAEAKGGTKRIETGLEVSKVDWRGLSLEIMIEEVERVCAEAAEANGEKQEKVVGVFGVENLSWAGLAVALEVTIGDDGSINSLDLLNACLSVYSNPQVMKLPATMKNRVLQTAFCVFDSMVTNRGR